MANVSSIQPSEGYIPSSPSSYHSDTSHITNGHKFSHTADGSHVQNATKTVFKDANSLDVENLTATLLGKKLAAGSSNEQQVIAEVMDFMNDKSQVADLLKLAFRTAINNAGLVATNQNADQHFEECFNDNFEAKYSNLAETAAHSAHEFKHEIKELASDVLKEVITPENYAKSNSDGTTTPLSESEISDIINEIAESVSDEIFDKYIPSYQPKSSIEKESKEKHTDNSIQVEQGDKTYTVALIKPDKRTSSTDKQFKIAIEIEILGKLIIIENAILEKMREEKIEEKREHQLQDLIDRIKHDVIKREIISQEVKTTEIKLQDLKGHLNKFIDMPIEEMVKISQVYNQMTPKAVVNGKIRLRLPGIHKMKLATAT